MENEKNTDQELFSSQDMTTDENPLSLDADPDFEIEDLQLEEESDEENDRLPRFPVNFHMLFIGLIVILLIVAGIRLFVWSRGEKIIIDPNEDTSQFDVETEDYIMYLNSSQLEERPNDGITTVLCLGNEPFASDRSETGLASLLEQKLGEKSAVYNASFAKTTLSCKNSAYDESYPQDAFNLYWLTKSICLQDYTLLDSLIGDFSSQSEGAEDSLNTLKNLDMESVDILLIMYDGQDYLEDRIITSPYDLSDIATCSGALGNSLTLLRETYPFIRIIVLSPTYACQIDENGNYLPGSSTNTPYKNGFLSDYMIAEKAIAVEKGVTFIDNYYGTITEDNYQTYLEDNIHLNDKGRELVAQRIAGILAQ